MSSTPTPTGNACPVWLKYSAGVATLATAAGAARGLAEAVSKTALVKHIAAPYAKLSDWAFSYAASVPLAGSLVSRVGNLLAKNWLLSGSAVVATLLYGAYQRGCFTAAPKRPAITPYNPNTDSQFVNHNGFVGRITGFEDAQNAFGDVKRETGFGWLDQQPSLGTPLQALDRVQNADENTLKGLMFMAYRLTTIANKAQALASSAASAAAPPPPLSAGDGAAAPALVAAPSSTASVSSAASPAASRPASAASAPPTPEQRTATQMVAEAARHKNIADQLWTAFFTPVARA